MGSETELLKALAALKKKEEENKLQDFKPYDCQLRFANTTALTSALIAGNQVGKTTLVSYMVACHLTGLYPDWWRGIRIPFASEWWAVGKDGAKVRDTIQRKLFGNIGRLGTGMIPRHLINVDTIIKGGVAKALDRVDVKNVDGNWSNVQFLAYDQGYEKFMSNTLTGGCIASGQMVLMGDATYKEIQKVHVGDIVLSMGPKCNLVPRKVTNVFDQGFRETIRVELKRGGWIECTPDHNLFSSINKKIRADESIRVINSTPGYEVSGPVDRSDAWYAWAGLVYSEGSVSCKKVTMGDGLAIRSAIGMLNKPAYVRFKDMSKWNHVPDWFLNWKEFWDEFPSGLSHQKEIPDWIFKSSNQKIALFLGYLYSGDGWLSGKNIGYASTSYKMSQQVCNLLWRLGIKSSVYTKKSQSKNWREQYWVLVSKAEDGLRFLDLIDVIGKNDARDSVRTELYRRVESNLSRVAKMQKFRRLQLLANPPKLTNHPKRPHYETHSIVRSKTPVGIKRVYDLSIEGEHRFIINNTLVSNCWLDEEPPKDINTEVNARLMANNGILLYSFTPAASITPFYDDLMENDKVFKVFISQDEVPHLTKDAKERFHQGMDEGTLSARRDGVAKIGDGKVFHFEETDYKIDPFEIPPYWRRLGGLDVGLSHPTGALMAAIDDDSHTIYITNEYRVSNKTAIDHSAHLKHWGVRFMTDPHAFDRMIGTGTSTASIYQGEGLELKKANNNVETSIAEIRKLIGEGRLYIFSTCTMLLKEMKTYRTKTPKDGGAARIVKVNDDLIDPMRYLLMDIDANAEIPKRFKHSPKIKKFIPADKKVGY